jgi:hypothetical protein
LAKEFVDYVKLLLGYSSGINIQLATNATYIPKGFLEVCANYSKQISLLISLDCGTRETYEKIKQRDLFEQVIQNLTIYSEYIRQIFLKYILLEENLNDIDAFLSIAQKLHIIKIINDFDFSSDVYQLTDLIAEAHAYFLWESYKRNINVGYATAWDYFDIIGNQLIKSRNKIFDEKIGYLDRISKQICLSIIGSNEKSLGAEVQILNVGTEYQPIWNNQNELTGQFILRDDINATRKMVVIPQIGCTLRFYHRTMQSKTLSILLMRSKWSGILEVKIDDDISQIDLYSEEIIIDSINIPLK